MFTSFGLLCLGEFKVGRPFDLKKVEENVDDCIAVAFWFLLINLAFF